MSGSDAHDFGMIVGERDVSNPTVIADALACVVCVLSSDDEEATVLGAGRVAPYREEG
tara:strand:- start:2096 stop:2269 length:174 start_codon:yes stop_codon:yes gene_type:complete